MALVFFDRPKRHGVKQYQYLASVSFLSLMGWVILELLRNSEQAGSFRGFAIVFALTFGTIVLNGIALLHLRSTQRAIVWALQRTTHWNFLAEKELAASRAFIHSKSVEAETLRDSASVLTLNMPLDSLLDCLLQAVHNAVPCKKAHIFLAEDETHLISLGQSCAQSNTSLNDEFPPAIDLDECPCLKRILKRQMAEMHSDLGADDRDLLAHRLGVRSLILAPLLIGDQSIGILCAGTDKERAFIPAHLRSLVSLASSASVAIQNARLRERAEILGVELSDRVSELQTKRSEPVDKLGRLCDDNFRKIFEASPVALSITTLDEDRVVQVNRAFELAYGFERATLIGRTLREVGFWENESDRALISRQLQRGPIRNLIVSHRTKSGEVRVTSVSADRIQLDGEECVLAISAALPISPGNVN